MNHVFGAAFFSDRDPDQNLVQMNSLLMNMISTSAFCDCQSQPLKQYFGDMYTKARFSVEDTFDKFLSASPIVMRPTRVFERFIESRAYTDIIQYRAEVPEGMKSTYLEYLGDVLPAQARANDIITKVIDPFSKFVGKLISDETFRNSVGMQIKEFKNLDAEYDKTVASVAKHFEKNDFHASAAFGDVVKRSSDWKAVFSQTEQLKKLYQAFPNKELTSKLNRLYEMLDTLLDQIKVDGYASVQKEVTELLAQGMYQIAKEVELAAVTTFRSKTFIETINTTIKNIEEVTAKSTAA